MQNNASGVGGEAASGPTQHTASGLMGRPHAPRRCACSAASKQGMRRAPHAPVSHCRQRVSFTSLPCSKSKIGGGELGCQLLVLQRLPPGGSQLVPPAHRAGCSSWAATAITPRQPPAPPTPTHLEQVVHPGAHGAVAVRRRLRRRRAEHLQAGAAPVRRLGGGTRRLGGAGRAAAAAAGGARVLARGAARGRPRRPLLLLQHLADVVQQPVQELVGVLRLLVLFRVGGWGGAAVGSRGGAAWGKG